MKIGNFCHVVKDPTDGDLFFAVIQRKYDSEDEWSIIASGVTEVEAMQNLIIEIHKRYRNCISKICQIGKSISDMGDFIAHEDLKLLSQHIEKEHSFGENIRPSFDAMVYNKEANAWARLYR